MASTRSRKRLWARVRRAVCCCFSTSQEGKEIEEAFQLITEEDLPVEIHPHQAVADVQPLQPIPNPPPAAAGPVVSVAGLNARLTLDGTAMADWQVFQTAVHGRTLTVRRLDALIPGQLSTTRQNHDENVLKGVYVIDGLFDDADAQALSNFPTARGWADQGVTRVLKDRLSPAQKAQVDRAKQIIRALMPVGYRSESPIYRFQGRTAQRNNIHMDGEGIYTHNVYDIRVCLRVPLDQSTNVISLVHEDERALVERGARPSYRLHLQPGQAYFSFGNFSLRKAGKRWLHWTESYLGMTYIMDFKLD